MRVSYGEGERDHARGRQRERDGQLDCLSRLPSSAEVLASVVTVQGHATVDVLE